MPETIDPLQEALAFVQEDLKTAFPDTDPALLLAIVLLNGNVWAVIREQAARVINAFTKKEKKEE